MNLKQLKLAAAASLSAAVTGLAAEETPASAPRYFCPAESLRGYYIALFEQGDGEEVKGNQVLAIEKHISAVCLRQQLLLLQVHENDRTLRERFGIPPDAMLALPDTLPQPGQGFVPRADEVAPTPDVTPTSKRAGAPPTDDGEKRRSVLGRLLEVVTAVAGGETEEEKPLPADFAANVEQVSEAGVPPTPAPVPGPIATIITPESGNGFDVEAAEAGVTGPSADEVQMTWDTTTGSVSAVAGWDPEALRIVGINLDPNLPSAVVRTEKGGPLVDVRPGEILRNGWRVHSIDADGLHLRRSLEARMVPMVR